MGGALVFSKVPIEEISVGMEESLSRVVCSSDVELFANISGDKNPIHLDGAYAKETRYKGRIAHGLMTASYFSALFGTKIPGEGCVYVYQSLKFRRPVYIDDLVTATVTVTKVDLDRRRVYFDTICSVNNKVVTSGEAELYVPK